MRVASDLQVVQAQIDLGTTEKRVGAIAGLAAIFWLIVRPAFDKYVRGVTKDETDKCKENQEQVRINTAALEDHSDRITVVEEKTERHELALASMASFGKALDRNTESTDKLHDAVRELAVGITGRVSHLEGQLAIAGRRATDPVVVPAEVKGGQ